VVKQCGATKKTNCGKYIRGRGRRGRRRKRKRKRRKRKRKRNRKRKRKTRTLMLMSLQMKSYQTFSRTRLPLGQRSIRFSMMT